MIVHRRGLRAVSVDSNRIVYALGFSDGLIIIRFANSDSPSLESVPDSLLDGHRAPVISLEFGIHDHSAHLISADGLREVILWRNVAGVWQILRSEVTVSRPTSVAFSGKGHSYAFALTNGRVSVFGLSPDSDSVDLRVESEGQCEVAFSGEDLVTVDGAGVLALWERDGTKLREVQMSPWAVHGLKSCGEAIAAVAFGSGDTKEIIRVMEKKGDRVIPRAAIPVEFDGIPIGFEKSRVEEKGVIAIWWDANATGITMLSYIEYEAGEAVAGEIWESLFRQRMDGVWEKAWVRGPRKKESRQVLDL
jgi:hypothetical protein